MSSGKTVQVQPQATQGGQVAMTAEQMQQFQQYQAFQAMQAQNQNQQNMQQQMIHGQPQHLQQQDVLPLLVPSLQYNRKLQFTTSLFVCDPLVSGLFCHPCMSSDNSVYLDNAQQCWMCLYPGMTVKNRLQAKAMMGVETSCFSDCCVGCLCPCCSECQVKKELESRAASGQILKPPSYEERQKSEGQFTVGLMACNGCCKELNCGCGDICCLLFCPWFLFYKMIPCCIISQNSKELDNAEQCMGCCYPGTPCKNRFQAKAMMGIRTDFCTDCMIVSFCWWCSECQIRTELERRKQMRGSTTVAPVIIQMVAPPQQQKMA